MPDPCGGLSDAHELLIASGGVPVLSGTYFAFALEAVIRSRLRRYLDCRTSDLLRRLVLCGQPSWGQKRSRMGLKNHEQSSMVKIKK